MTNLDAAVAECQAGDPAARQALYSLCANRVYRLMVRMVGLEHAADVTQQVFLELFQKIDRFHGLSRFETWLYRLAVNEAYRYLRRERRWKHEALCCEPLDRRSCAERDRESKQMLDEALSRVDAESRSIFLLRECEGLSYREIAQVLEIPEGTVASRLNRARRELRGELCGLGWEPPR